MEGWAVGIQDDISGSPGSPRYRFEDSTIEQRVTTTLACIAAQSNVGTLDLFSVLERLLA
jgi:hypothetical protein